MRLFWIILFRVTKNEGLCPYLGMNEGIFFKMVGKRLREIRIQRGYTAYDTFAFTFDLPKNSVIRAEVGKPVSMTTLIRILNALKISPEEFFKGIK